jgi:capsular polysaccharide biosynthesis protein
MAVVAAAVRRRGRGPGGATERANGRDLLRPPRDRSKPQQGKPSPRLLRTLLLKEIHGPCLPYDRLIEGSDAGYTELFPAIRLERSGSLRLEAPPECAPQLDALKGDFADTGYPATAVTLTRLKDVVVGPASGVCVTADGGLVEETTFVARMQEPSLANVPFISLADNTFTPDGWPKVTEPLLHCFHPAISVYGHFLFDVLPIVLLLREAIQAGQLKVLMPRIPDWGISRIPDWGYSILREFGIEQTHIFHAPAEAIHCSALLVPDTLTTFNTFTPNPGLCALPATAAGIGSATPWRSRDSGARIYLSRERQPNLSNRDVENEEDVRAVLRNLGFTILEPANMAFKDQVNAINGASVIVGVHGSGFANLMFARPGTLVIDLMPQDLVGYWGPHGGAERWLLNVTTAFSLDYTILLCRSQLMKGSETKHIFAGSTNVTVDIGRRMRATVDLDLLRRVICGHDAD